MAPAMSVTSPSAETSAPPARSLNWLSTTRPRSGEKKPRADQSSMVRRWQQRRLGPDPASGRFEVEGPARAVGALRVCTMLPVNCTRLSPQTSTEGAISKRRAARL